MTAQVDKYYNVRVQLMSDSEQNWEKKENFIPYEGEVIVYNDAKYPRLKIGNGLTPLKELEFLSAEDTKVKAGWYGQNSNTSLASGGEFTIPKIKVDKKGKVQEIQNVQLYLPTIGSDGQVTQTNSLPLAGGVLTGPLTVTGGNDVQPTVANSGYLFIGKADEQHIVIDSNEIMSKTKGDEVGQLTLQGEGGQLFLGTTKTEAIVRAGNFLVSTAYSTSIVNFSGTSHKSIGGKIEYQGPYVVDETTMERRNRSRFVLRCTSFESDNLVATTGYTTNYYLANTVSGLTKDQDRWLPFASGQNLGSDSQPVYLKNSELIACNSFIPSTGGTLTGGLIIDKGNSDTKAIIINESFENGIYANSSKRGFVSLGCEYGLIIQHDKTPQLHFCNIKGENLGAMYINTSNGKKGPLCLKVNTDEGGAVTAYLNTKGEWCANKFTTITTQNDYAEYRGQREEIEPGRAVTCEKDGVLFKTTERLQSCEGIVSDTFGFTTGMTEKSKTPLAVAGRVLAYTYEDRNSYNVGDAVCCAPNGTISRMTREEIVEYPERIIGIVSEIPEYEYWGDDNILVNGRIWIKVK